MTCSVQVPLDDIVAALVSDYSEAFVVEILKRLNLTQFVTAEDGVAKNLTLRGGITVDDAVKANLCSALQECISDKIQEELGCERDNHVIAFSIDDVNDLLTVEMKFGEKFSISKEELQNWLKLGGSTGGSDTFVQSGEVLSSGVLRLTLNTGDNVDIDASTLLTGTDTFVQSGEVLSSGVLRLTLNTGDNVDIDASTLVPNNNPYIISGTMLERNDEYYLDFLRNDGSTISVDMTAIINRIIELIVGRGYRINTVSTDYTITGDDFDGRTIIRANADADMTVFIDRPPSEDFVGKAIIIRKSNGSAGTYTYLTAAPPPVTDPPTDPTTYTVLSPADASPLRRVGSSATLVYTGNGNWDVFAELP